MDLEIEKKRQMFRSWHRGTREMDMLLGRFADACVPDFNEGQVILYDRVLKNSDPDLYNWVTGKEPVPPSEDNKVMKKLMDFKCHEVGTDKR